MQEPTHLDLGEGRRRWNSPSERVPRSCRGSGDGMQATGTRRNTGNPSGDRWLRSVVEGHNRYYGVPMNGPALIRFRFHVVRLWQRALSRRSQNGRVLWDRMMRIVNRCLPLPRIHHPYPLRRLGVIT